VKIFEVLGGYFFLKHAINIAIHKKLADRIQTQLALQLLASAAKQKQKV